MAIEERVLTISDEASRPEEEALAVEAMEFNPPPEHLPVTPPPAETRPAGGTGDVEEQKDKGPRAWLESSEANDFGPFLLTEMKRIKPPHACVGNRSEMERSLGQHKKLNGYISKALRSDYDDKLDVKGIDSLRAKLEHGIDQLEQMLEALEDLKRNRKKMRRRRASDDSLCEACAVPLWHDPELDLPICVSCVKDRKLSKTAIEFEDVSEQYEPTLEEEEEIERGFSEEERERARTLSLSDVTLAAIKDELGISAEDVKEMVHDFMARVYGHPPAKAVVQPYMTKNATVAKVQYFATAFERAITGALVNGKVSGGRNLDELYAKAKKAYSITPREELAIFQILADMGYPTFKDRLRITGGDEDPRSTSGDGEWQTQYYA